MIQDSLFSADELPETVLNPLCPYMTHCGRRATLDAWEDRGGCVNRTITAIGCACDGESSSTYEQATKEGWVQR